MAKRRRGTRRDFETRYRIGTAPVLTAIEREVLGTDYGVTGYTTVAEVGSLHAALALSTRQHLLDVGCGAGWPGLRLAEMAGCRVTLADAPLEGLQRAAARGVTDGVDAAVVAARGEDLPFRDHAFDAVVTIDALCWLDDKLSVLRACRRVTKPGGRLAAVSITVAGGLSPAAAARAEKFGPDFVSSGDGYQALAIEAGYDAVEVVDVTAAYAATLDAWGNAWARHAAEVIDVVGEEEFADRQSRRHDNAAAIADGLLVRQLVTATAT